ncbi:hypothetical protein BH11ARM1_BH11ARM1_12890 [soil metagenome]
MRFQIGLDAIASYRRLSYTPWHALAEFVDNSTQSYFDHREVLDASFLGSPTGFEVSIVYDRDADKLTISDNAAGMDENELAEALKIANHPPKDGGRSKYGMGMKTAACWFGNKWKIRTKRIGQTKELTVTIDVQKIASGDADLNPVVVDTGNPDTHYTDVEIESLHRKFNGRTLGKIKEFMASMYRSDLRTNTLSLFWQGTELVWSDLDDAVLKAADGKPYKKPFEFEVGGLPVHGWVAVLDSGSRRLAGFSIMQNDRVIKGFPDSWRPERLYGQEGGSNDMVNQRLVGEFTLTDSRSRRPKT